MISTLEIESRAGFKKTKLGWIPEDWVVKLIGDYYDFKNGLNKGKEYFGKGTAIINYKDVYKNQFLTNDNINGLVEVNESEKERYSTKRGDVFFTRTSETVEEIAFAAVLSEDIVNGVFSGFVLRARPVNDQNVYPEFAAYCFNTFQSRKKIIRKSTMTTRALTNGTFLSQVNIAFPPFPEQKAIANCLSTWDSAITKLDRLIKAKQQLKKALMQQLLSGDKRLPGFDGEWEELVFSDIADRIKRKNEEADDTVVTISAKRGFVLQEDFFNKRVASNTLLNYTLVHKGEYCYNKSYSKGYPMGAFKRLDDFEKAVVTTLYICFSLKENVDSDFMNQYFEAGKMIPGLMRIAQEGGRAHGLLNISLPDFFSLPVFIPMLEEQTAIAQVLNTADQEIALLTTQRNQLQLQKKGLMQQLLTGKKRLKI